MTRHCHLRNVLMILSFQRADCDTDHSLVCCKIKLQSKKIHHRKRPGKQCTDVSKIRYPDVSIFSLCKMSEEFHLHTATSIVVLKPLNQISLQTFKDSASARIPYNGTKLHKAGCG
ncbi:Hypothetical predicted protein [Octopus vulgaris]|uniref:Uncharacterized protein n=1 Tax=Octopus vulgaris TaxID=6645 RepID=A0AA36AHX8_OCTVU|nr:Hypothetical predicted protein [Octopus vulgaris]